MTAIQPHLFSEFAADPVGSNERYTPSEPIELARAGMGSIDTDPATHRVVNERYVRARWWYDLEANGLLHPWYGNVWCNPPYSRGDIDQFVDKLLQEHARPHMHQCTLLVNASMSSNWMHRVLGSARLMAIPDRRFEFWGPFEKSTSMYDSLLFYFASDFWAAGTEQRWAREFEKIGKVVRL
tara:strand:- start:25 stop:570 length:546 start_codon:yes stop_codon:yes gene_type:complete